MVDFDKFEKNVKNKYGNQEFPFDEQNWEKAAQLIDASRKGKNRGGIILWSVAALLCTSGLVYYFGFSDNAKVSMNKELAVNQIVTANEKTVTKHESNTSENNSVANTAVNSNEGNVGSDMSSTSSTANSSTDNISSENISNASSSKVKTSSKNNSSVNNSNVTETISNTKSVNENNKNTASNNETKAETKSNTASTTTSNETMSNNNPNSEGKKTTPIKSNVKSATPPVLGSNNSSQNNNVKPIVPNTNPGETGNTNKEGDVTNNNTPETPTKNNPIVTDSTSDVLAVSVKPTESTVVDSVPATRKSKADSLAAMQPKGDGVSYATNVKEKHNAKNILLLEAGTTYLLGWNGGGKNEAGGFNLLAGINFQHYFTGTIAAQIGVQYSTISNLTNTTHTISTVNYDFGMEQDVTSIRYQKLHYVIAPIKVTYNIGDKNIVGLGCNIGYLLNSDSKKENYTTHSSDPNATKNDMTSTKESGYVQGFNPIDIQVGVSYRRKIYKGLSANAEFFYGLTDTKDNKFFKSDYFDRNVGFKVSLCYDLFKK